MTIWHKDACHCACGGRYCASNRESVETKSHIDPDQYEDGIKSSRYRKAADAQQASLQGAVRHYYQWTGAELEVAARRELTAGRVAEITGRTIAAVRSKRKQLYKEPKWQKVIGMKPDGTVLT